MQGKFVTWFDSICTNHMHCLACANELTKRCSWMSFCPSPILELFNILLALMHGIKKKFNFFPFIVVIWNNYIDALGWAWGESTSIYIVLESCVSILDIIEKKYPYLDKENVGTPCATYLLTTCTFYIWMSTLFANVVFVVVSFKLSKYELKQVTISHVWTIWWVLLWTCII